MINLRKMFTRIFTVLLLFFYCGNTIFSALRDTLVSKDLHKKGVRRESSYKYTKDRFQEIANSTNSSEQMQLIKELAEMYNKNILDLPSAEPDFILDLCDIVRSIPDISIRFSIIKEILNPLIRRQLIYDNDISNSRWEQDEKLNLSYGKQLYRVFYRTLESKTGKCLDFTLVGRVILDRLGIPNAIIFNETHMFNAYLLSKLGEYRIWDVTWGILGSPLLNDDKAFFPSIQSIVSPPKDSYLDKNFNKTSNIYGVMIPYKLYNEKYSKTLYQPQSYFEINFNDSTKRRELSVTIDGKRVPGDVSSKSLLSLWHHIRTS